MKADLSYKLGNNEPLSEHHVRQDQDQDRAAGQPERRQVQHYRKVRQGSVRRVLQCNTPITQPTVGIDFLVKNVCHQAKNYRLQLWDTAGQERFRSLIPNYLKDARCAVIVIDVTNRASLNSAEMWLKIYNDNRTVEGFTLMVGNKIDL